MTVTTWSTLGTVIVEENGSVGKRVSYRWSLGVYNTPLLWRGGAQCGERLVTVTGGALNPIIVP